MGTIEERLNDNGKKAYRAKIRLKGFPPQSATFSKKTDAKIWIQQTETEIREGRYLNKAKAQKYTVGNVIDRYLESLTKNNPRRKKDVKSLLGWWKTEIGDYRLSNLSKDLFIQTREKLQNKKRERKIPNNDTQTISNATVNRYWISMQTALNFAVNDWEWLTTNPMTKVAKLQESEGRMRFLSDKERVRLIIECQNSKNKYLLTIVNHSNPVAIAEAWGYTGEHDEGTSESGLRLKCSKDFLKSVLSHKNMDLLIFIKLENYEKGYKYKDNKYSHTTAVVVISKNLEVKFYKGLVNHLYVNKW